MIKKESLRFLSDLFAVLSKYDDDIIKEALVTFNESSDLGQVKKLCEVVISNIEHTKANNSKNGSKLRNKSRYKLDLTSLDPKIKSNLEEIEVLLRASKYAHSKKELLQFLFSNQIQANAKLTKDELIYLYIEKIKEYTEEELLKIKEQLSDKRSKLDIFAEMMIGNSRCNENGVIVTDTDEIKK